MNNRKSVEIDKEIYYFSKRYAIVSDDNRVKCSAVGLIPDSPPVELKADLIGATRMRIVFRGAWNNQHPVIRLGESVKKKKKKTTL